MLQIILAVTQSLPALREVQTDRFRSDNNFFSIALVLLSGLVIMLRDATISGGVYEISTGIALLSVLESSLLLLTVFWGLARW